MILPRVQMGDKQKKLPFWNPGPLKGALFIRRLNRFVAEVDLGGKKTLVHVPNTGRMGELVIPGTEVLMRPSGGKYLWRIMYFYYKGLPVLIDSIEGNAVFAALLDNDRVPGMEGCRVVRREVTRGSHRFDFLVRDTDGCESLLELKSCTLAWKSVASFPDAVSSRASSHVRALSETGTGRVVFLNLHDSVETFLPNYHTDYIFSETLSECKSRLDIRSFSVRYNEDLGISRAEAMKVQYPESGTAGVYFMVIENDSDRTIEIGDREVKFFKKGFYLYGGSSGENLFKKIEQHRRKKRGHHHIDYMVREMKIIADVPVVSNDLKACDVINSASSLGGEKVPDFEVDACSCSSHLYFFENNPLQRHELWDMVLALRYDSFQ